MANLCHTSNTWCLCPSLTVLNLLPNEHKLTIWVCSGDHSWSFLVILAMTMTMTINSNSVAVVGQYESFEHVQIFRVPSKNNFHSCLWALKRCSYHLCCRACVLYSCHSYCIPGCSNCILCYSYMTVRLRHHDQKTVRNKTDGAWMCQRLLQSRYWC